MAGRDRMTVEEVVRRVLREEHGDVIREYVRAVAQELMEAEVSELIGAEQSSKLVGKRWNDVLWDVTAETTPLIPGGPRSPGPPGWPGAT